MEEKGWRSILLGEFVTLQRGFDITKKEQEVGPYKVYSSSGPNSTHSKYQVKGPGVIIGRKGTLGTAFYSDEDFWPHDTTLWVKDFHGNDPKFAYHFLKSMRLEQYDCGASNPTLNRNHIHLIPVSVPLVPIQQKIAVILSAYDDLIENNLRRIKILEEMARSLYREWFVKFRFPGHQKVKMVNSPLGKIPEGWEVEELRNIFDIKYGKTLPKTKIPDKGLYPVYGAGDVIGYYDKVICQEKCALVTSRGNGSGTVWRTREAAFVTNNSLIILPKIDFKHWDYSFIELFLKHSNVMEAKTGSAQPQVTIENLNYVKGIVPGQKILEGFTAFSIPIYEHVDLIFKKNRILRQTRDLLLPKLISGELDVSELDIKTTDESL